MCIPSPDMYTDEQAPPSLCADASAIARSNWQTSLTETGWDSPALAAQRISCCSCAQHPYPSTDIYVFARDRVSQAFARELGAVCSGETTSRAPDMLHAIIDTTPAWTPIVESFRNLRPGGRLVINAIRKEDADKDCLQNLSYHEHLWLEKEIKTVANITHRDIAEFLPMAAAIPIIPKVETYPLEDANRALLELRRGHVQGAKVLVVT